MLLWVNSLHDLPLFEGGFVWMEIPVPKITHAR
jgi:hypothetical protein